MALRWRLALRVHDAPPRHVGWQGVEPDEAIPRAGVGREGGVMENTDYDLEAIYDEQIYPLMEQIITICQEHRIPLVCSFQYGTHDANTDDEDRGLCTTYSAHGRKCRSEEHT